MSARSQSPLSPASGVLVSVGVIAGVALTLVCLIKGESVVAGLLAISSVGGIRTLVVDARLAQATPGERRSAEELGSAGL